MAGGSCHLIDKEGGQEGDSKRKKGDEGDGREKRPRMRWFGTVKEEEDKGEKGRAEQGGGEAG